MGATFVEPGISELTNALSARTVLFEIGEIDGRITDRIRAVAEVLGHMDNGKVEITDNLMGARWLKLMLNCCMSGLSSALGCTFESVISSERRWPAPPILRLRWSMQRGPRASS